jgi:hypothetical protein
MTAEDLYNSLPDELRVTSGNMRPEIAVGLAYLTARDAAIDAGVPVADAPTFAEWRRNP